MPTVFKVIWKVIRTILLIFPFTIHMVVFIVAFVAWVRLLFPMNKDIRVDLRYIHRDAVRYIFKYWDVVMGKMEGQAHHTATDLFGASIRGALATVKTLLKSLFIWR
jgi:hypothetical protein